MIITPLSGNELYCLAEKGYSAGNLVSASSLYSPSYLEMLTSGLRTSVGKELKAATEASAEGWRHAYQRMFEQAQTTDATSIINISCFPHYPAGFLELLLRGSSIRVSEQKASLAFSSAANGQELYAQIDAGYQARHFTFGNSVYASGLGQSWRSSLKSISRGEIKEFSELLGQSRRAALERLKNSSGSETANAILGIKTMILPLGKACEILMMGSACYHPALEGVIAGEKITSGLSDLETWNLARLGYTPLALLLGSTVYSIGLRANTTAALKAFFQGEIRELSYLMQEAREKNTALLYEEAKKIAADEVVGVKSYAYSLGNGLIDFLMLGTAIKKLPLIQTSSEQLPPQVFRERDSSFYHAVGNINKGSPLTGLLRFALLALVIVFVIYWQKRS